MPASRCSAWTKCQSPSHQPRPAAKPRESNRPRPSRDLQDPEQRTTQTWRSTPKVPRVRSCTSQSGSLQFMLLDFGRQADVKARAPRRVATSPQAAPVRFHDGSANPKAHTRAVSLRGKERIEDLVYLLRRKPGASIADGQQELVVFRSLRFDVELPRPICIPHRIDGIHHEIHENLLQLHAIDHDLGKIRRQLRPNYYVVSRCFAAEEDDHPSNNFVYLHQLPLRRTLLEELADSADDFGSTRPIVHDSLGSVARLFQIGMIARQPAQAGVGVGDGSGNRLIYFVRQGGRQLSHGGHPADPRQIRLRLAQGLFGLLALTTLFL